MPTCRLGEQKGAPGGAQEEPFRPPVVTRRGCCGKEGDLEVRALERHVGVQRESVGGDGVGAASHLVSVQQKLRNQKGVPN